MMVMMKTMGQMSEFLGKTLLGDLFRAGSIWRTMHCGNALFKYDQCIKIIKPIC
jgi:hypothetical protein